MNPFDVICFDTKGYMKDPHPMGACPIQPKEYDFKDKEKFLKAIKLYEETLIKWNEIEAKLIIYLTTSIITDAQQVIPAKVLFFHVGKKYKAIMDMSVEGNCIQIV